LKPLLPVTEFYTRDFILLADDDIDDQELLVEALIKVKPGIHIHSVTNGYKAISFLNDLPADISPCLIVLDYNLPEINGSEVLEAIRQTKKFDGVTKVVWSTSNSPVFRKECMDLGAKAYLVKPSDINGIYDIAHFLLDLCGIEKS
jgi:CheY-like chemotaxis protein